MSGEDVWSRREGLDRVATRAPAPRSRAVSAGLRRIARLALRGEPRQLWIHDWRRSLAGEPALPAPPIRAVAVVCAGNICRSPFAAALLERMQPALQVTSYGLAAAVGDPADARARVLAPEWGCDLASHRTRPFGEDDARAADLILAMDVVQGRSIARRWPAIRDRVRLLGDFLAARPFFISDPWSEPEPEWRATYARIADAVQRLNARLGEQP